MPRSKCAVVIGAVAALCLASLPAAALPEGFVHLSKVDSTIVEDMRYAGAGNFLGRRVPGYEAPSCILTREAADALARVQAALNETDMTLVVFDCYRPAQAVAAFVDWAGSGGGTDPRYHPRTPRDRLIAEGYIAARSGHSRGSTVDVGIAPVAGAAAPREPDCGANAASVLAFGTGFDCFDRRSRTASGEIDAEARANRRTLVEAMAAAGFRNYPGEWWHFTLAGEPFPERYFDFPVTAPE